MGLVRYVQTSPSHIPFSEKNACSLMRFSDGRVWFRAPLLPFQTL